MKDRIQKYFRLVIFILYIIFIFSIGIILYFLSKIVRSVSYILLLAPNSAKGQLKNFWFIEKDLF